MSYAVPPPPKTRPSVVNWAAILLWVVVAMHIISLVLSLLPNAELDQARQQFFDEHPGFEEANGRLFMISGLVSAAVTALIAIGLGVLAIFVRKGSQPARIVTWVVGGLLALCQVCLVGLSSIAPSVQTNVDSTDSTTADVEAYARVIADHTPAWLTAASFALSIIGLLALIVAIILLALPAANDYFRKTQEVWTPPTSYSGGGFPPPPPPAVPQNPSAPPPPPPAPPQQQ